MTVRLTAKSIVSVGLAVACWAAGAPLPAAAAPGDLVVGTPGPTCVGSQFTTIQGAVAAATAGATIRVCAGTYPETVTVDKPLTFLGAQAGVDARTGRTDPSAESIVDSGTGGFEIQAGVSSVTIDGFTVRGAGTPTDGADGIAAFSLGSGYSFVDNIITDNTYGINMSSDGTLPTLVEHNRFVGNNRTGDSGGAGVFISTGPADATTITENSFSGHSSAAVNTTGNAADFSRGLLITDNTSTDDSSFAVVVNATDAHVTGNTVTHTDLHDPDAGSAVYVGGNTEGVRVAGNTIVGGAASGVRVTSLFGPANTNVDITGNSVASRLNGIRISGGVTAGTIGGNSVTGSSNDGILVEPGNSGLRITGNTSRANTVLDCEDRTTGAGTAGTANQWTANTGATSAPIGICSLAPALTIGKTHPKDFRQGQRGARYTLTVVNAAVAGPTLGTAVTVADTLPPGLRATAITGTGWTCTLSALTCTRSDTLAAGAAYPPITLTVDVSRHARRSVTNTATVSGGGDTATHTALDFTTVKRTVRCPFCSRPHRRPHHRSHRGHGFHRPHRPHRRAAAG